jgi:hypothetical protein
MAASSWIKHVKKYAKDHKIEFGEALKKARPSYKASTSSTKKMRGGNKKTAKNRTKSYCK